ncbi:MAG: class I tRNA ligase family protein, partial [Pseudomonadota bacterium]
QRINNDLANDLGNLAQRVLSMVARSLDGMPGAAGSLQEADQQILDLSNRTLDKLRGEMGQMRFHKALEAIWALIGDANRYVDHMAPWQLRKHDQQRMQQVLYVVLEVLRRIGLMIIPFMPQSASQLLDQLAQPEDKRNFACWGDQIDGTRKLPKPVGLFPRYVQKGTSDANG